MSAALFALFLGWGQFFIPLSSYIAELWRVVKQSVGACFAKRGQCFHFGSLGTGEHPTSQEAVKSFDESLWWLRLVRASEVNGS